MAPDLCHIRKVDGSKQTCFGLDGVSLDNYEAIMDDHALFQKVPVFQACNRDQIEAHGDSRSLLKCREIRSCPWADCESPEYYYTLFCPHEIFVNIPSMPVHIPMQDIVAVQPDYLYTLHAHMLIQKFGGSSEHSIHRGR